MILSKSCLSTFVWISLLPNTWKTVLLLTYKKDFALSDMKKKHFTDILECSINKKLYKDISKKGTQKSFDKWYRKKVNTFSCYTNVSPSVDLTLCYF